MAGSSNTREQPSASSVVRGAAHDEPARDGPPRDSSAPKPSLAHTQVLWMGRDAAPAGVAQILTGAGCTLCDRNDKTWPPQRVAWLSHVSAAARVHRSLRGRRIAVVHPDPGASDALAEALRARGAQVVVLSLGEAGLDRAEALDPEVLVMQPDHLAGTGLEVVESVWRHARLRWIPILLVPHARLGIAGASAPNVRDLSIGINLLCGEYESLARHACRNEPFELQLHDLGPMRTLRALLESTNVLRARFETPDITIEVDLIEGLIIGAQGGITESSDRQSLLGVHAIAALQSQVSGKVSVWPVAYPAVTNIMAPLETILLSQHTAPALADEREPRPSPISVRAVEPVEDDWFDRPTNQRTLPAALRAAPNNENGKVAFSPARPRKPPERKAPANPAQKAPEPKQTPAPKPALQTGPRHDLSIPPATKQVPAASVMTSAAHARPTLPPPTPAPTHAPRITQTAPRVTPPPPPPAIALVSRAAAQPVRPTAQLIEPWPISMETMDAAEPFDESTHTPTPTPAMAKRPFRSFALLAALSAILLCGAWAFLGAATPSLEPAPLHVAHATSVPASAQASAPTVRSAATIDTPTATLELPVKGDVAPVPTPALAAEPVQKQEAPPAPAVTESDLSEVAQDDLTLSRDTQLREASRLVGQGHQLRREGKYDAARAIYANAARAYPNYPRALAGLAEAYLALGDKTRALEAARAVVLRRPKFADDHRLLGDAYKLSGRTADALSAWQRAALLGSATARQRLKAVH